MKVARHIGRPFAGAALVLAAGGCSPAEQAVCGTPASALEVTTRTEDGARISWRTERSGTSGNGVAVRVETTDGRLLALDETPPRSGAPAGAAVRSVVISYDDADRLSEATIVHLDGRSRPLSSWQVMLGYTDAGEFERIEAIGQPPASQALDDVLGSILPGLSEGELTWLHPLPGADLLGPLPADVDAVVNSRPPGLPLVMAADVAPIDGGFRATWTVGGDGFELALPVEHVTTESGWIRTWVGNGQLQTVSLGWSRAEDGAPGDGDLVWRLEGAEFERHRIRTTAIADGTREEHTVLREGAVAWRRVADITADGFDVRTDGDGDGRDDELRVRLPAGDGRTIEVIDIPPFGPVDLYRFTETEDATVRSQAVAPNVGQQLCAVDGGPVLLEGEPGDRRIVGVPDGLPDPPPE